MQLAMNFVETRARRTDCDTSKAAAKAAVSRKADSERLAIVEAVKTKQMTYGGFVWNGLTAKEVAQATDIDYIEVQRRISECGLIKTDWRRDGCRVWVAA
jgi:hypothetical protein